MDTYPKACVILGAGASHDIYDAGSKILNLDWQPPLTVDLFDTGRHHAYLDVLHRYPGAEVLAQELAPLVSSGQASIEDALRHYADHPNSVIRRHFKQVPGYLRDLLFLASYQYTSVPSSYIRLVTELLAEHPHHLLFIVLNYDTLLESALNQFNNEFQFNTITEYVDSDRTAKVVKLHGSINWFKSLGPFDKGWFKQVDDYDIFKMIPENEILLAKTANVCDYLGKENVLYYPVITAPLAGKDISKAVCPPSHITVASRFLKDCQKFLIVGSSGLDKDLLSILDSALVDLMKYYHVHIVGLDKGADDARSRFMEGVKAFRNRIPTKDVWSNGFRHYLQNGLRSFSEFKM